MSVRGKRLLVLGAGRGQVGLYKAAKRLGVTTIAAGVMGDYPGLELADEICDVDITNPDSVVERARLLNIDGVATSCMDTALESLGHVCDELGLVGISREIAKSSYDKKLQKEVLSNAPGQSLVAQCRYCLNHDDVLNAVHEFGLPVVLKGRHSQGSSSVFVVQTDEKALAAFDELSVVESEILVEEYLSGDEFGAQAFVNNGRIRFVMPHGDVTCGTRAPMPLGHYLPLDEPQDVRQDAIEVTKRAIRACGYDNCAINVDLRMHNGRPYILELTPRAGASGLPELTSYALGMDYYELVVLLALGAHNELEALPEPHVDQVVLVQLLQWEYSGVVKRIDETFVSDKVSNVRSYKRVGDKVDKFDSLKDCVGQVLAIGETLEECTALVNRQAEAMFQIDAD